MKLTLKNCAVLFGALKGVKMTAIPDSILIPFWNNLEALRPFDEQRTKSIEEAQAMMREDSSLAELDQRINKAKEREELVAKGEYTMTEEDIKDVQEVQKWYDEVTGKLSKLIAEVDSKEVEVELYKVPLSELLQMFKSSDKTMDELSYTLSVLGEK